MLGSGSHESSLAPTQGRSPGKGERRGGRERKSALEGERERERHDYTAFQNTFTFKAFLHYIRIFERETKQANSNF